MQNIQNSITVFTHFHRHSFFGLLDKTERGSIPAVCSYSSIASLVCSWGRESGWVRVSPICAWVEWDFRQRSIQVSSSSELSVALPVGGVFKTFYLTWMKISSIVLSADLWGVGMTIWVNDRKAFLVLFILLLRSGRVRDEPFRLESNIHRFHYEI